MKSIPITAAAIVILHQAIALWHGLAHQSLGVGLVPWQQAYVTVVISILPLVAMVMYWTTWWQSAAMLLGVSMLASLLFGVYHHFIAISPDHISHLPEGDSQGTFVLSAILLIPSEALGAVFGFWSWRKFRRTAI